MPTPQETAFGVLEPIGGGDSIPLLKEHVVVGRRESCDICLRFSNVSSRHCELTLQHGYWKVRDLQSTNGVKVNGERVIEKRIYPGDELTIAKHRFRVDYVPTTSRSTDAEVDELHEDIMRFSLLERAGLVKRPDAAAPTAKLAKDKSPKERADEETALEFLEAAEAPHESKEERGDQVHIAPAAAQGSGDGSDEDAIDEVTPATSAHDLSDEEFLKIVADEEAARARKKQN